MTVLTVVTAAQAVAFYLLAKDAAYNGPRRALAVVAVYGVLAVAAWGHHS